MTNNESRRLVVLGMKVGDPVSMERWAAQGHLSVLRSIMERGCHGRLAGPERVCEHGSATTLFTGAPADRHGYYYFRPYHVMHVYSQQELATRWGGDPRNPYDNTMFQRIYEQMGIEAKPVTATTTVTPEYTVPGPTYTPTPVPTYQPSPQPFGISPGMQMTPGLPVTPGATTLPGGSLPMPSIEPIPSPGR